MVRVRSPFLCLVLLLSASGCLAVHDFAHPGDEKTQVARAQIYDPYPEPDFGPPIVGGRPREYLDPRSEVLRVQPRMGEPVVGPGQAPTANNACPPGYGPAYQQGYSQFSSATASQAGGVAPPWAPPANAQPGSDQPGNVIYVPPPAVSGAAPAGP